MAPISIAAIEDALYAWLFASLGVPVIWEGQDGVRQPAGDYGSLQWVDGDIRLGAFDAVYSRYRGPAYVPPEPEEEEEEPPPVPEDAILAGEEMALTVLAEREALILVQAYSDNTIGSTSAWQRLRTARTRLGLPSVAATFEAAGFVIIDPGALQVVPRVVDADFEGRATFRLRIRYRDTLSEFSSYIETVNVSQST